MAVKEIEEMITIGSRYRIMSTIGDDKPLVSMGEFRGYAAFANETALVLRLDGSNGQEAGRDTVPAVSRHRRHRRHGAGPQEGPRREG